MNAWLLLLGTVYLVALVIAAMYSRSSTKSEQDFLMAGASIGPIVGCLTIAATLFSTFTLMGMPDMFRTHGVGAWIFLGVSDCALAFTALWFGVNLRRRIDSSNFSGFSDWLRQQYRSELVAYVYLIGIFIFLVPYVAIQIKGISLFLTTILPGVAPPWVWSAGLVSIILMYSEAGGLKAIVIADSMQGVLLLISTLIIGYGCVAYFGSLQSMFEVVAAKTPELLVIPGPSGLMTVQFLIASFLVLALIPISQPQMAIRLVVLRDTRALARMALFLGIFSFCLILATAFIGFYGAARYPNLSTIEFIVQVLVRDQSDFVGAMVIVGLIAAAISTADSQLFALGSEMRAGVRFKNVKPMTVVRGAIVAFAIASLVVSLVSSEHIVLLARTGFAGTALLAPMILAAVFCQNRLNRWIPIITGTGLLVFLLSLSGIAPTEFFAIRADLALLMFVSLLTATSILIVKPRSTQNT